MFPHNRQKAKLLRDDLVLLTGLSVVIYICLYIYHGFMVYGSDTIETVPYAMWMADQSLFSQDFHVQSLRQIFPNERWLVSYLLHFFPQHIPQASLTMHAVFGIILCGGMLRLADHFLKNYEWSVLAVFVTFFSLYNINVGGNELYYNFFVPSLTAKAIAVWALLFFVEKKIILASAILTCTTFLHPLVGLQLFVVLSGILCIDLWKEKDTNKRESLMFFLIYLLTAGVWIVLILRAQGPKEWSNYSFAEIVKFRIAHHFYPQFFPKSHVLLHILLYTVALVATFKKRGFLFYFFIISLLGILIYCLGLITGIDIILSSQWMKINIWLKFFGIISAIMLLQNLLETRWHRLLILVGFVLALGMALVKYNPSTDREAPTDLYGWINVQTEKDDLFLVPPELTDFKAMTSRSSYFDFKAMLHHRPEIFEWASRFEDLYGLQIGDRSTEENIFVKVNSAYMKGPMAIPKAHVDFFIVRSHEAIDLKMVLAKRGLKALFLGENYHIYGIEEK